MSFGTAVVRALERIGDLFGTDSAVLQGDFHNLLGGIRILTDD